MDEAVRGMALGFVALLSLAIAHKASTLKNGRAHLEPLMRVRHWRRRRARELLVGAIVVELALAGVLLVNPSIGFGGLTLVLAAYMWAIAGLPAGQACNCLGSTIQESRSIALVRNGILAAMSGSAFLGYAFGAIASTSVDATAVSVAVIATTLLAGYYAVAWLARRWGTNPARPARSAERSG